MEDLNVLHREGGGFPGLSKKGQGEAPGAGEQPHTAACGSSLDVVPCASCNQQLLLGVSNLTQDQLGTRRKSGQLNHGFIHGLPTGSGSRKVL